MPAAFHSASSAACVPDLSPREMNGAALALIAFSLAPYLAGLVGQWYVPGALLLGLSFLGCAIAFGASRTPERARRLFFASIIYLPLLLGLLVTNKIRN